ncbi:MAG: hypothetical protein KatS3mg115_1389 [Candidatus Poribacteria bacterium]|nr:MAG: hypothetical protein KatS3mg115_1389 [Candidatus Poribacteria bacterium]
MGARLRIEIYDNGNTARLGRVVAPVSVRVTRGLNEPDRIELALRRNDPQAKELIPGRFLRVFDAGGAEPLATGVLLEPLRRERGLLHCTAVGALIQLALVRFPPGYLLTGDLADDPAAWTCAYDWRTIQATQTTASGAWGDEILTFPGFGTGNTAGEFSNTEAVDLAEPTGEREDLGGVRLMEGGGLYPPNGVYVTPFLDFRTPPDTWDRLRYGLEGWGESLAVRVASFEALSDPRSFSGTPLTDPGASGRGISLVGLPPRRYLAVEFTLNRLHPSQSPRLRWIQAVARRNLPGVLGAVLPTIHLGALNLGGYSLRAALERLCATYLLEYRLAPDGTLQVQPIPEPGTVGSLWGQDLRSRLTLTEGKHFNWVEEVSDPTQGGNYLAIADPGSGLNLIVQDAASLSELGYRQAFLSVSALQLETLKALGDQRRARWGDWTRRWRIELLRTPNDPPYPPLTGGTGGAESWGFAPGDLIRLISSPHGAGPNAPFDRSVRIVREVREETENGLRVLLEVEERASRLERALAGPEALEPRPQSAQGCFWTPVFADDAPHTLTVPLNFTPSHAGAVVLEVEADPDGTPSYGTSRSGSVAVEVVERSMGLDHCRLTVQRIGGALPYRARVLWWAEGVVRRL